MAASEKVETSGCEVTKNLGLVHACAHRFCGRGIDYDDLFQAGCVGLVKAIKGFDSTRGVMLSTYAVPVILGEIRRLFRDGGTVKVSRSLKEMGLRAMRCKEALENSLGCDVPISKIAEEMGESPENVSAALIAAGPPLSLTQDEENGGGQFDIPAPSEAEHISDLVSLRELLLKLESPEKDIIYYRYFKEMTQSATAEKLGLTQVQISRKEKKIIAGLRSKLL